MDEIKGSGVYMFCSDESILEYLPELEERLRSRIEEIEQNIKIIKADLLK